MKHVKPSQLRVGLARYITQILDMWARLTFYEDSQCTPQINHCGKGVASYVERPGSDSRSYQTSIH